MRKISTKSIIASAVLIGSILCLIIVLKAKKDMQEQHTAREIAKNVGAKTLEEQLEDLPFTLQRTDTITSKYTIQTMNAEPKQLFQIYLQKWNIIIPATTDTKNGLWASFNSDGVTALKVLGLLYNFNVHEKDGEVVFSKGIPGSTPVSNAELSNLGITNIIDPNVLFSKLSEQKQAFIAFLPTATNIKDVTICEYNDIWVIKPTKL